MGWIRRKFLAGLLILLPTVVTIWILYKVFVSVDSVLKPLIRRYPFLDFPGLGFVTVILLILAAGVFAGNLIGKNIISWLDGLATRVPLINKMYTAIKQISEVFLKQQRTVFSEAVLVEYPRKGVYAIGFIASTWEYRIRDEEPAFFVNVFLPTTPNPTTGIFLMMPREEAIPMTCSVEEAFKMVISGGAILPGSKHGVSAEPSGDDESSS